MADSDGSIVIGVNMNVAQAEKDLAKLKKSIEKTERDIEDASKKRSEAQQKSLFQASELDAEKAKLQEIKDRLSDIRAMSKDKSLSFETREDLKAQIPLAQQELADQKERVRMLQAEWNKTENTIAKYSNKISESTEKLDAQKTEAGELARQIESASKFTNIMTEATKHAGEQMRRFTDRIKNLVSSVFVFTLINTALRHLRTLIGNVIKKNDEASAAIAKLKGALIVLVRPIVEVVIPAFISLVNILTKVVMAVANFVSALFGKSIESSVEAAKSLYEQANAYDKVGSAAKKASKNLASFDELNVLQSQDAIDSSGAISEIAPDFDLSGMEGGILSGLLKFTIDDIFFEWKDLTAENIAAKCITGLMAIAGGIIGFAAGGFGGMMVGITLGSILGLVISSVFLDGDGSLSESEILNLIVLGLVSIAAGVFGFLVGGVHGAVIAIMLSAVIMVTAKAITIERLDSLTVSKAINKASQYIEENYTMLLNLSARIEKINPEIDSNTMGRFELARDTIEYIYSLNPEKDINAINDAIDILKNQNFDSLTDAFKTFTKDGVLPAREEVDKLLESTLESLKQAALYAAIQDAYIAQLDIEAELNRIDGKIKEVIRDAEKASHFGVGDKKLVEQYTELIAQKNDLIEAQEEVNQKVKYYQGLLFGVSSETENATEKIVDSYIGVVDGVKKAAKDTIDYLLKKSKKSGETLGTGVGTGFSTGLTTILGTMVHPISTKVEEIFDKASKVDTKGETTANRFVTEIGSGITGKTGFLQNIFQTVIEKVQKIPSGGTQYGEDLVTEVGNGIIGNQSKTFTAFKAMLSPIFGLSFNMKDKGKALVESLVDGIKGEKVTASKAFSSVLNAIIDKFNTFSSNVSKGISNLFSFLTKSSNSTSYSTSSGKIRTTSQSFPSPVPALARGAVIPPNREFMAVLGDQKHGTNIEAPLSTIQEAVALVMEDQTNAILTGFETSVGVQREILEAVLGIQIGDDVIGNAVARYNRKLAIINGGIV